MKQKFLLKTLLLLCALVAGKTGAWASANSTTKISLETTTTHDVYWSVNGVVTTDSYEEGTTITFPAHPDNQDGKYFVGWASDAITGTTNEKPTFVKSATMGTSDLTYYAVFADRIPSKEITMTDVLTSSGIGQNTYDYWKSKTFTSSAIYAGYSTTYNGNAVEAIQMNSSNNKSGIVTTTTGGKVKKIRVEWNAITTSGRKLDIYGKNNKAYSKSDDLYNSSSTTQGTKIGSIKYGTSTELAITGDYTFIGLRAESNFICLNKISIDWLVTVPETYAAYCTTIPTTTDVTITAAKYATFSNGRAADFSGTGIKVYTAEVEGTTVKMNRIADGIVPANTGVILYCETPGTYPVTLTTTDATISSNSMVASVLRTFVAQHGGAGYNYIMQKSGDNIVFNMATEDGAYMPAGRAYLSTTVDASAPAASSRLSVVSDDAPTGIAEVEHGTTSHEAAVYDLQGRRVNKTQKGLYIKDGKKIIMK